MPDLSQVTKQSTEAMSIKYNTMVYDLKRKGVDIIVMSLGEAYFDIPLYQFDDLPFPDIYHYSHSRGLVELRDKLGEYFKSEYDFSFDPEAEIIVTAGSKVAIHMAFMAILNPGDEVLIPEPAWVSYPEQVKLCYGEPVGIPYDCSIYDFEKYITDKTKAIIINNPHNPTGYVYTEKEMRFLLDLAKKYDLWLFSDEAYSDFVGDGSFVSLGSIDRDKKNSVIFNSISKNYGISGWRFGYLISNAEFISNILKLNQHMITCPATILAHYIATHFDEIIKITKPQIKEVVDTRNELVEYMNSIGLKCLDGTSTFYCFVSIEPSKLSSEEFCMRLLQESYVCVVPGLGYGDSCDGFVRVSVGTATREQNEHGLQKIKELIDKTS